MALSSKIQRGTNFLHQIREREWEVTRGTGKFQGSYFTPSLVEVCAQVIADDFPNQPSIDDIDVDLQQLVISKLSTGLDIFVAIPRVQGEDYWKSCCEARWTLGQLADSKDTAKEPGGWKRVYLERYIEDFMANLPNENPTSADNDELERLCKLAGPLVKKLHIGRLKCHVDVYTVFAMLPKLRDFKVTYGVLNSGMEFQFKRFGIRPPDCMYFAQFLRSDKCKITTLSLPENHIDSDKIKALITGLVKNSSVTKLDLSHNKISDAGARALATLLVRKGQVLESLNLCDNNIRAEGARALSKSLTLCSSLTSLNCRLNRIGDEGGRALFEGLRDTLALKDLNVSNNDMGIESARVLGDVLRVNTTLTSLDVAGNAFGDEAGPILLDAVENNKGLRVLDVRMSGIKDDERYVMNDILKKRPIDPPSTDLPNDSLDSTGTTG